MASVIQRAFGTWNITAPQVVFDNPVVAGHTIMVGTFYGNSFSSLVTTGYTQRQARTSRTGTTIQKVYTKVAVGGEQTIVGADESGGGGGLLIAYEIDGAYDSSNGVDDGASNLLTFTNATLSPVNVGGSGVIVGLFCANYQNYDVGALSANSPLTERAEIYSGSRAKAWAGDVTQTIASSYSLSVTSTVRPSDADAANTWSSIGIVFADATSGVSTSYGTIVA